MDISSIIQLTQSLWVFFIVIMLFVRFRIGVAAYLAYMLLVPYMRIEIGDITLQWNFVNILLFVAFYIQRQKKEYISAKYDWHPLYPFLIYFGISLVLMFFQDGLPLSESYSTWRVQIMKYLILPFVIWNDILVNKDSIKLYRNVTIGCIGIAAVYGLFLTTMPGLNPYIMFLSTANGEEFNFAYAAGYSGLSNDAFVGGYLTDNNGMILESGSSISEDRMFGRISSVFAHPMTFGLFLGLSLFYLFRNKDKIQPWVLYGLTAIIFIDTIVCGVRTVIAAIAISIIFLLLSLKQYKRLFYVVVSGFILFGIISYIPVLDSYLGSIFDTSSKDVGGSSLEMRLSQLDGCFKEIKYTFLEGNGYGWTKYYEAQNGSHPTLLSFESLLFVILCNSGIIGLLLWVYMGVKIIKYNQSSEPTMNYLFNTFFVFYIAFALITGEYGYMMYFILFYILMLGEKYAPATDAEETKD